MLGADLRRRTRLVIDDEVLVARYAELVGEQPRNDIGGAACREGHDDSDGLVGIALAPGRMRGHDPRRATARRFSSNASLVLLFVAQRCTAQG